MTFNKLLAGASLASAKPKFAAVTTVGVSSEMTTRLLVAVGASLTATTLMVAVSVSVLVRAAPEPSLVNMVSVTAPLALLAGVYVGVVKAVLR